MLSSYQYVSGGSTKKKTTVLYTFNVLWLDAYKADSNFIFDTSTKTKNNTVNIKESVNTCLNDCIVFKL